MIIDDLARSCRHIMAYWRALKMRAIANWPRDVRAPNPWPERSWVLSYIAYGGTVAGDSSSLLACASADRNIPVIIDYGRIQAFGIQHTDMLEPTSVSREMQVRLHVAFELLERLWPGGFEELRLCASSICTFDGKATDGFSDPRLFGCIFIHRALLENAGSVLLAERLVHEAGHHALFVETSLDRLIPEDFAQKIYSPLRGELRSALGVLHSAIALARMTSWLQIACTASGDFCEADRARLDSHMCRYEQTLHELRVVRFSEHGRKLYEALCRHYEKIK